MKTKGIVCLNGRYLPAAEAAIPAGDRGVLYGMGIFETIRVAGGVPRFLDRHLSRLFRSAGDLGLEVPFGESEISLMARGTASENRMGEGALRLTLTAGGEGVRPGLFVTARENSYTPDQYRDGIRAGFSSVRKNELSPLARHKTLNYFENIIARREAGAAGWGEAFFLNTSGYLAEGAVSNIFLVAGGTVVTPDPASGLLPGITRERVIEACLREGIKVEERAVLPAELHRAGECFITNSLMGVLPVIRVGDTLVGSGGPGAVTRLIASSMDY